MQEFRDLVPCLRSQFPALSREVAGAPAIFLDGPGGSQTPQRVIDAVGGYLARCNANHGGCFATSRESDELLERAHVALADFVGGDDPDCIVFGANMTSLTFALSRALARSWRPGDEVVVTRLDHDANVSPWVLAARDAGAVVQLVNIQEDCTLDLDDFRSKIGPRTRLVAVGCASNATGGVNPVAEIAQWAHAVGAHVFLDAVHLAPHSLLDVRRWDCDFLTCSAYKFFGPHVGILWGKRELLESTAAYKVRPAPDTLPGKWMTGTQSHEGVAGALEAVEYLADIGRQVTGDSGAGRRAAIVAAMEAIGRYERRLAERLNQGLASMPSVRVHGITDPTRFHQRLPTFSISDSRMRPQPLAEFLGRRGIFVWHGNYYALNLSEALGLEPDGMLRIGLMHYNTEEEVDRLLNWLNDLNDTAVSTR